MRELTSSDHGAPVLQRSHMHVSLGSEGGRYDFLLQKPRLSQSNSWPDSVEDPFQGVTHAHYKRKAGTQKQQISYQNDGQRQ